MTEKMLNTLKLLSTGDLYWNKTDGEYVWAKEDGTPSGIYTRTITALEQRGWLAVIRPQDGPVTARITAHGLAALEKPVRPVPERLDPGSCDGPVDTFFRGIEGMCALEEVRERREEEDLRDWVLTMHLLEDIRREENCPAAKEPEPLKKQTIVLVDSENIGNTWLGILDRLGGCDELHVFYTDKSPTLTYQTVVDLMSHENIKKLRWVRCCVGNNALDFQLATELGSMVAEKRIRNVFDPEYIVMSRDSGYDPVIHYWACQDVRIHRFSNLSDVTGQMEIKEEDGPGPDPCSPGLPGTDEVPETTAGPLPAPSGAQPAATAPLSEKGSEEAQKVIRGKQAISLINSMMEGKTWREKLTDFLSLQTTLADPKASAEYLIEMSKLVSVANERKYLRAVVAQFGNMNGKIIMDEIRKNKFLRINLSNGLIRNVRTRKKNYIMLFLRNNGFLDPDIRSISPLLGKPTNVDMDNIKHLLLRNHNEVEATCLVKTIDKHLQVIKDIN